MYCTLSNAKFYFAKIEAGHDLHEQMCRHQKKGKKKKSTLNQENISGYYFRSLGTKSFHYICN